MTASELPKSKGWKKLGEMFVADSTRSLHGSKKDIQFRAVPLILAVSSIALLVIACIARPSSDDVTQAQPQSAWALLQQNEPGYVVIVRHALAPGTGDPPNFRLGDCTTQRNLSVEGRSQAMQIGKAFRSRKIGIARVLSSQWCRCLDTARLMNLGKVESFPALNSFFDDRSQEARQTLEVRRFIVNNRNTQGAIVMVTHQVNITGLTGIVPQQGESVVLRTNKQGQVEVVGRLTVL